MRDFDNWTNIKAIFKIKWRRNKKVMNNDITHIKDVPLQTTEEFYKPLITRRGVGIVIAGWSIYTVLAAVPLVQYYKVSFLTVLYWQTCQSIVMFTLSIPVWFIIIRWMYSVKWIWKVLAHLFLAPIYAVLNYLYLYYTILWFGGNAAAKPLINTAGWLIYFNFLIYLLQFTYYHSYEILRKLRVKEKIALELSSLGKEQELATLKAQINPHFLFNTLNSISATVSTDIEETRTMITQLADLLRYATESSKENFVPLKEELQFVHDYIALESKRLEDRLTTKFQIDQSLDSFMVPPMILQPLVENAIKHGIAPAEEGGRIDINIMRQKYGVVFKVSNTGVGISCTNPLTTANGVGLRNTNERLKKIFGYSSQLKIIPLGEDGCEVTFILPLK